MGRKYKRKDRVRRQRGQRMAPGAMAGQTRIRGDGVLLKVGRRVGARNRTVYTATLVLSYPGHTHTIGEVRVTAKALRKMAIQWTPALRAARDATARRMAVEIA